MQCSYFFEQLWRDYTRLSPQVALIYQLFSDAGDRIVNDHVAFRTFDLPPVSIGCLERHILALGYRRFEPYVFEKKNLKAWSYLHTDGKQPRIFFSELLVENMGAEARKIINYLVEQIPSGAVEKPDVFWHGRLWKTPYWRDYQILLNESEYAAWLSVMGLRANHFTISVNNLKPPTLDYVINKLRREGIQLNEVGGIIKGTPGTLLEQTATLADSKEIVFAEREAHTIKTCYYEFAKRYPNKKGELYQGFVPANADNIFHSTDRGY